MSAKIDIVGDVQNFMLELRKSPEHVRLVRHIDMLIHAFENRERVIREQCKSQQQSYIDQVFCTLAPSMVDLICESSERAEIAILGAHKLATVMAGVRFKERAEGFLRSASNVE